MKAGNSPAFFHILICMKKYRIVKHTYRTARFLPSLGKVVQSESICYEVQKRFLGFLWWYNFNNIDGVTTGMYNQLFEAEEAIQSEMYPCHKKEVVKEYEHV